MAFAAVSYIASQFENQAGYWIKFYEQGTTTPKVMATDSTGGTTLAKAEISSGGAVPIGFIQTVGDAILIPFVDGAYDLWAFPTSTEADANDTTNAIQLADNTNASPWEVALKEYDTLTALVADVTNVAIGDVVILKERTTGNGGGATWDVVDATTVTEDEFSIVTGDATRSFVARFGDRVVAEVFGVTAKTDTSEIQAWIDYCVASDLQGYSEVLKKASITYTVGTSGNFSTINEGLRFLANMRPPYSEFGGDPFSTYVELSLLTGFVMAGQVRLDQQDLSWITITSVDAEVTITRSALSEKVGSRRPAFGGQNGSRLPRIAAIFNMDATGTATGRDGVYVATGSSVVVAEEPGSPPIAGVKNAGGRGLHVATSSFAVAENTVWSGAVDIGARISNSSVAQLRDADLSNAQGTACLAVDGANVDAAGVDCSGATTGAGAAVSGGSNVHLTSADCTNAATIGLQVIGASVVEADSIDCSDAGTDGIECKQKSTVSAENGTVSTNLAPAGRYGINADGGIVHFKSGTCVDPVNVGINVTNGGEVNAPSSTATGSGNSNVVVSGNSRFNGSAGTFTGATSNGVHALTGSWVNLSGSAAAAGTVADIVVESGSTINAVTATGTPSKTANTITVDGIIYQ